MIPYSRQTIEKNDIKLINQVLKSNIITQGKKLEKFESLVSKKTNSKFSVATNSATSALHIACLSLELNKNDYLWTVPNTFIASANCARYCGAKVDFVDIDKYTFNISPKKLKNKLINAKKKNKIPKIFVGVDLGGNPYDHKKIHDLLKEYKVKIISDSSHSLGAKINNYVIGSNKWSDITIFSFHPVKPITTAEGGIATTNNKKIFNKLKLFRSHGITRNYKDFKNKLSRDFWYYEQHELGYNYRMNEIQSALGISQIRKLDSFTFKRRKIANLYTRNFKKLPISIQKINKGYFSTFHLYIITFPKKIIYKKLYSKIFNYFRSNGIGVNLHYLPVHLHPYYKKRGFREGNFINSEEYSKSAFSLPIYPTLTLKNQNKVIKIVNKICKIYFNDKN